MIVKGTRQLGSFKRGINLYIPKNIAIPELTIPMNGLKVWLKADAGVTESGGSVILWADQSGEGNDAANGNSPTKQTNQINGFPAINFTNSQWLQIQQNSIGNTGNLNVFIILNYTSGGILLNKGDGATYEGTVWEMAPQNGFGYVDNSEPSWAVVSYVPSAGAKIIEMACDAGSIEVFENNISKGSAGPIGSINAISQYIGIGGGGVGGSTQNSLEAKIAEIIIYDTFLTSNDRASVYSYLNAKYAIY
jgi:hypothetical protein